MGEDLVGGLGPGEGTGAFVVGVDEPADGVGQLVDGAEGAAPYRLPGDDAEEDLDHVEPGSGGRGEVQGDPRVALEPRGHLRGLMRGVVVAHHVQLHAWVGLGHLLEERQELLVAVLGVTAAKSVVVPARL